jgi:hypothetical protein
MYSKLFKIFAILLFVAFVFPAGNSFAFKSLTRDQLIYDAIEFCPAELKEYLRSNLATISTGMHYKERHHRGINTLIDPYDTELIYRHLIEDLKEGRYDEFNTRTLLAFWPAFWQKRSLRMITKHPNILYRKRCNTMVTRKLKLRMSNPISRI